jgi:DNA polymerase III delta subunit
VVCDLLAIRTMSDGGQTASEISAALKMHEYRVGLYLKQARKTDMTILRNAVNACQTADRALKRSATDGYGVIERVICTL